MKAPFKVGALYGEIVLKCPGCHQLHVLPTTGPNAWRFNGDTENPTLQPSIKATIPKKNWICHSIVANGKIRFLDDCTHDLKNQTVDLLEVDEHWFK